MTSLLEAVRRRFPAPRGRGVVAVSGGADSVALLRALTVDSPELIVAHVNHGLRGAESDGDERFVADLAFNLNLSCRTIALDVAAEAKERGENLEAVARRGRYEWLTKIAEAKEATWIATGHTADDQAETVLHRLLRGTGLQGLRGIAAQRELRAGLVLVRPMLDVSRQEVLEYLAERNQTWREDRTNVDLGFTRNRIRRELLPVLKTFNTTIVDVLNRLAEQAGDWFDVQQQHAAEHLKCAERPPAGPLRILQVESLANLSRPQIRDLFHLLWEREGWPAGEMSFVHWDRLAGLALGEATAHDLSGGVSARRRGQVIQIGPRHV